MEETASKKRILSEGQNSAQSKKTKQEDSKESDSCPTPKEKIKDFLLKLIVKENHNVPITTLSFNDTKEENQNLVAMVGGEQVTVYDNKHFGNHLDLYMKFDNVEIPQNKGCVNTFFPPLGTVFLIFL